MASPTKQPRYDFEHDVNEIIQKELWSELSTLLQDGGLCDAEQCHAVEAASKHCVESIFLSLISPHCTSSQLHSALPHLASRGLWQAVGHVLQRGVSTALCIWTPQEPFTQAEWELIRMHILPYCTRDYPNRFMSYLISKGRWDDVDKMLQCEKETKSKSKLDGLPRKLKIWTVSGTELEKQMLQLVAKGRWRDVGTMLTEGVGDSQHESLIHTACLHATEVDFEEHVLPHCIDRLLDSVLTVIVGRRAWLAVEDAIRRRVRDSKKQWAVLEACDNCDKEFTGNRSEADSFMYDCGGYDPDDFIEIGLLPGCASYKLDSVLSVLADCHLGQCAIDFLEQGVSDCKKRWAMQEEGQDEKDYFCEMSKNKADVGFISIVPQCANEEVDDALRTLVKEHIWRALEEALEGGDYCPDKIFPVHLSCEYDLQENMRLENDNFSIFTRCGYGQEDDVMKILAEGRLWRAIGEALERGVSGHVKLWAVEEACKMCIDDDGGNTDDDHDDGNDDGGNTDDDNDDGNDDDGNTDDDNDDGNDDDGNTDDDNDDGNDDGGKTDDDHDDGNDDGGAADDDDYGNDNYGVDYDNDNDDWDYGSHSVDVDNGSDCEGDYFDKRGARTCFSCLQIWAYLTGHFYTEEYIDEYIEKGKHYLRCADDHLPSVLPTLAERNLFKSVRYVLKRKISDTELCKTVQTVFMNADESLIETVLPCYVYDDVRSELQTLASGRLWKVFLTLLQRFMIDTLHTWGIVGDRSEPKERVFWDMVSNPCDGVKELSPAKWRLVSGSDLQHCLKEYLDWDTLLCEVLYEALLGIVREIWLSGQEKEVERRSRTAVEEARSVTEDIHQQLKLLMGCKSSNVSNSTLLPCINRLCQKYAGKTHSMVTREPPAGETVRQHDGLAEHSSFCMRYRSRNPKEVIEEASSNPLFQLHFLKYLTREYYKRKAWTQMTDAVLVVLTTTPVVPSVQSVALRIMVREKRWDVIRHACLSCVCEQDRRQVFQAAVKQRQWGVVKRWADYSLYDDQRLWALGEAKGEKRWDVYVKLAGHGLSEWERMGVLYRVAMHADWKLVRHMVNTVADVSYMKDLLTNARPTRQSRPKPENSQQRIEQLTEFEKTLKMYTNTLKTLKAAAKRGKWQVVLYNIRHKLDLQHAPRHALKAAVSSEAWQAVIQLVRLETDVTRRNSLFRDMVSQQQWAVCRELLEQGVSDELCVQALNDLMEHRQWTLVAMVMRCPMSEERKKKMMFRALRMREGSVVWQCINTLRRTLSEEERVNIFHLAFNRKVWQAVKPLVEIKDETGIRHRDTALLEAIEQHQWDVVDHCQRHHADINMKDDDGHTPIHRAARKGDWEAVKELTVRDGDPNLLDSHGDSVLHMAILAKQWDLVKLLIQFHGDIHRPSRDNQTKTALNMLIDARQVDVIQSTFMWCADQWNGINYKEETTLHAACLSGCPGILHDLIARRVDPLAVTSKGLSALCYAVLCRDCPQAIVAECIKLGFGTYEPQIQRDSTSKTDKEKKNMLTSPLMMAVMRGLPVVTQMLYESGVCSNRQLFTATTHLATSTEIASSTGQIRMDFTELWRLVHGYDDSDCSSDTALVKKSADYLRQVSCTTRSLVSTCRLVISRCLTLSKTRHRDIAQLPLLPEWKNYLMFTDLTDPAYVGNQD
ncbi:uncharacterized protein [Littorina saxatilis]|uniref:uncharacterized protein n=1 Tax=Littorina saxatilis TaxID=31220 RepID=UPI0038B5E229